MEYYSWLFKQILWNLSIHNLSKLIKVNFNEFSKSWRVIIFKGFGITKRLKKWISIQNLFFNSFDTTSFSFLDELADIQKIKVFDKSCRSLCKIAQNDFGWFSFTSSRFSWNNNCLIFLVHHHILICIFSYWEQMWFWIWDIMSFLSI